METNWRRRQRRRRGNQGEQSRGGAAGVGWLLLESNQTRTGKKGRNGVAVPLLDAAQIDAQRRRGGRETVDQGGRKVGRGGKEGGRWQRGESEAARQGGGGGGRRGRLRLVEKWRRRGLGLVESIYINITMNVDRPITRSRAPSDRGVVG
jgi:hypothetical protein